LLNAPAYQLISRGLEDASGQGIAALEDKIAQHAIGRVLNQIWEEDFKGYSYGFRPGTSQHDALDALYVGITSKKVNWVVDLDTLAYVPYSVILR